MKPILDGIERMGDERLNAPSFRRLCSDLMVDLEPDQVSPEMWARINLTLEKSPAAQRTFHNVPELDGAELYRRLVAPLGKVQPSISRRNGCLFIG